MTRFRHCGEYVTVVQHIGHGQRLVITDGGVYLVIDSRGVAL